MKYFKTYLSSRMLRLLLNYRFESPLLDIGCGPGYYLRELDQYYQATGIDLSQTAIELCLSEGLNCRRMSFYDIADKYRSLVCIDVLEHVHDDSSFLNKMFAVLSGGGKAFIMAPSGPFKEDDLFFGHYRRYSRKEITGKVLSCGFRVLHSETFGYPFLHYARLFMLATHTIKAGADEAKSREERTGSSSYLHYADKSLPAKLLTGLEKMPVLNSLSDLVLSSQRFFAARNDGFAQIVIAEKPK